METEIKIPQTLTEAIKYFADPDVALAFFVNLRWPAGVTCPLCGGMEHSFIKTRRIWQCKSCKKQFSAKLGTIFEDSALKLETWMAAMWLICNSKNGVSSHEISRSLGVTQKTAWFMLHRIRTAMETKTFEKLSGTVEVDETAIGGLEKNKHRNKRKGVGGGIGGKEVVLGFYEHGGDVRTMHVSNIDQTVPAEVRANVESGSNLLTDTWNGYKTLGGEYDHTAVNHHIGQYVKDGCTTNRMENYWSVLKRTLKGSYIHVSADHLHRYLSEQEYRFNHRGMKDGGGFVGIVVQSVGKRLTYKTLTEHSGE